MCERGVDLVQVPGGRMEDQVGEVFTCGDLSIVLIESDLKTLKTHKSDRLCSDRVFVL